LFEFGLTSSIFDDDGWIELPGLWANVVLLDDPACFKVQRHQEAAARAAEVLFGAGEELLKRAAALPEGYPGTFSLWQSIG